MKVKWIELKLSNLKYLDEVLEIYDNSFPIEVREEHKIFIKSLKHSNESKNNNYHFLVGLYDKKVVSFATCHYLYEVNSGFIVYLATNSFSRNIGLGKKTLLKLEELLKEDSRVAGNEKIDGIFLETEMKELAITSKEKEVCEKRNRFFNKNGYIKNDKIEYLQPPLYESEDIVPLNLFVKDISENTKIDEVIKCIYKEKYSLINNIEINILNDCLRKMRII